MAPYMFGAPEAPPGALDLVSDAAVEAAPLDPSPLSFTPPARSSRPDAAPSFGPPALELAAPWSAHDAAPTASEVGPPTVDLPAPRAIEPATMTHPDAQFDAVFKEFLATKRACGEDPSNVSFEKFVQRLRQNRDQLIKRHGCADVKFQVYVKDGKATLRASPVTR